MDLQWQRMVEKSSNSPVSHLFTELQRHMDSCLPQYSMSGVKVEYIDFHTTLRGLPENDLVYRLFRNGGVDIGTPAPEKTPEPEPVPEDLSRTCEVTVSSVERQLAKEVLAELQQEFQALGARRALAGVVEAKPAARFAAEFAAAQAFGVASVLQDLAAQL